MRQIKAVPNVRILTALMSLQVPANAHAQEASTAAPADYARWDSDLIQTTADRLEGKLADQALVWETIGNYNGHSIYLVLRGRTGQAEIHETESDVQIGVRGTAISVIGGAMVDAQSLPRKQIRGTSIDGGERRTTAPGDLIHIPSGVPHQLIVDPAEPYTYLLFKIDEEPLD
jgi:mannose-6-phosphate isomerase-like protein (cupin superfamily)